jgi:hypothetical protein
MITQILYNASSKHCSTMVTVLKLEMVKGKLDLEEINQVFRKIYGKIKHATGTRWEGALITRTGNIFKKKFKGDYRTCGKKGHKSAACWEKPANKGNPPAYWKSTNNTEAAHSKTNTTENYCDYCDKDGHTDDWCYKKIRKIGEKERQNKCCVYIKQL